MIESALAIIGIFFIPPVLVILIIWFLSIERRKRNKLQAELYTKALEKGQELPANFFVQPKKKKNALNVGIICIAVGIGISLFIYIAADGPEKIQGASLGIIPFFIGLAYLLIYFIGKKQGDAEKGQ